MSIKQNKIMFISEKTFKEKDGTVGYYEAVYESSNVLATTYFPRKELLYISFSRGGVYSYSSITKEIYEEFKTVDSQGKFFIEKIMKNPQLHVSRKEYTLYPEEVKHLKEMVENPEPVKYNEEDDQPNIENLLKRLNRC